MQRKMLVICLALVLIAPSSVWALGLGKVEVKSSLNQPLLAEIPILSARARDLDNMTVKLAPPEMFERSNIRRSLFLSQLKFEIDKEATPPVVTITSRGNITDPFVVLIMELNWANGRIMREFTLMIDPPRGLPLPRMKKKPARQASATGRVSRPTDKSPAPRKFTARPTTRAGSRLGTNYGTVRSGQTLWEIAKEIQGSESMTTEQLLMALYRTNPQAFSDDNVNALLAGRELRVPTEKEVAQTSAIQASAEFREHVRAWRRGVTPKSVTATKASTESPSSSTQGKTQMPERATQPAQRDAKPTQQPEKKKEPSPASEQVGPRLQVLAPSDIGDDEAALPSSVDELQSALIQSRDESNRVQIEKEQQTARLQAMQDRLALLERLVTLKDQELATLQQQSAQSRGLVAPEEATGAAADEAGKASSDTAVTDQKKQTKTEKQIAKTDLVPAETEAAIPPRVITPDKTEAYDFIWNNPKVWMVAVAVMLVLFLLIWIFVRTLLKGEEEDDDSDLAEKLERLAVHAAEGEIKVLKEAEQELNSSQQFDTGSVNPFMSNRFGDTTESDAPAAASIGQGGEVQESQIDEILKEVKVFLNYGRQDHAVNFLVRLIDNYPDEIKPRVTLLRLYYDMRKPEQFGALAQELWDRMADRTGPEWLEVATMGRKLLPDHPLFSIASPYDSAIDTDENDSLVDDDEILTFDLPDEERDNKGIADDKDESTLMFDTDQFDFENELEFQDDSDLGAAKKPTPDTMDEFDLSSFSLAKEDDQDEPKQESNEDEEGDSVETQLELAKTYLDMGDTDGAVQIIKDVLKRGTPKQIDEASRLLLSMDDF